MGGLSREQARRVYDRIGARQDTQAFYEDPATRLLVARGEFSSAHRVFELGCGTGRFALELMSRHLPPDARYRATDLSPVMVGLARERLARFGARAEVSLTDGSPPVEEPGASFDRFVANYVLDLLSEDDIARVIREAHRMLEPAGLLCLVSLSTGTGTLSRWVSRTWARVHALAPALVGGCRPIELASWVHPPDWRVRFDEKCVAFGVPSEVLVAERRAQTEPAPSPH